MYVGCVIICIVTSIVSLTTLKFFQMRLCIGDEVMDANLSNFDIIREKLTRSLPVVLPEVIDELSQAIPDYIPTNDHGKSAYI